MMDRFALHKITYGLYVLTTVENETPYGCIVNTAQQVTATPARVSVACNKDNYTHDRIKASGVFGLSVLSEQSPQDIIGTFGYSSGRTIDKFENVAFDPGAHTGVPLLRQDTMTVIECKVIETLDVGTHTVFVGDVLDAQIVHDDDAELTYKYYQHVLKGNAPKNAPTYIPDDAEGDDSKEIYKCSVCGYEYDKENGAKDVAPGTAYEELDEGWVCPVCGAPKTLFHKK